MTKFISIMIQIKVFSNEPCFKENRPVYEQIIKEVPCNFANLIDSLRVLYGSGCVITFNILPL